MEKDKTIDKEVNGIDFTWGPDCTDFKISINFADDSKWTFDNFEKDFQMIMEKKKPKDEYPISTAPDDGTKFLFHFRPTDSWDVGLIDEDGHLHAVDFTGVLGPKYVNKELVRCWKFI